MHCPPSSDLLRTFQGIVWLLELIHGDANHSFLYSINFGWCLSILGRPFPGQQISTDSVIIIHSKEVRELLESSFFSLDTMFQLYFNLGTVVDCSPLTIAFREEIFFTAWQLWAISIQRLMTLPHPQGWLLWRPGDLIEMLDAGAYGRNIVNVLWPMNISRHWWSTTMSCDVRCECSLSVIIPILILFVYFLPTHSLWLLCWNIWLHNLDVSMLWSINCWLSNFTELDLARAQGLSWCSNVLFTHVHYKH